MCDVGLFRGWRMCRNAKSGSGTGYLQPSGQDVMVTSLLVLISSPGSGTAWSRLRQTTAAECQARDLEDSRIPKANHIIR